MNIFQYIDIASKRLILGETLMAPPFLPSFPPQVVEGISSQLGLLFIPEKVSGGNVCLAHTEEVKPAYRTVFSSSDLLNYLYAVWHSSSYITKHEQFVKDDLSSLSYPKDAEDFWRLVDLGGQLRLLHMREDSGLESSLHPFPIMGDKIVSEVRFVADGEVAAREAESSPACIGRIYINESQYFDEVPTSVWNFEIDGEAPAQIWIKERKGQALKSVDILHYQKILVALTETGRLVKEIDG